jgi:hypothetical protein
VAAYILVVFVITLVGVVALLTVVDDAVTFDAFDLFIIHLYIAVDVVEVCAIVFVDVLAVAVILLTKTWMQCRLRMMLLLK